MPQQFSESRHEAAFAAFAARKRLSKREKRLAKRGHRWVLENVDLDITDKQAKEQIAQIVKEDYGFLGTFWSMFAWTLVSKVIELLFKKWLSLSEGVEE